MFHLASTLFNVFCSSAPPTYTCCLFSLVSPVTTSLIHSCLLFSVPTSLQSVVLVLGTVCFSSVLLKFFMLACVLLRHQPSVKVYIQFKQIRSWCQSESLSPTSSEPFISLVIQAASVLLCSQKHFVQGYISSGITA